MPNRYDSVIKFFTVDLTSWMNIKIPGWLKITVQWSLRIMEISLWASAGIWLVYTSLIIDNYHFYPYFHANIVGLFIFMAISRFDLPKQLSFKKHNISSLFVSFGLFAPLSNIHSFLHDAFPYGYLSGLRLRMLIIDFIPSIIDYSQCYWLLILIQIFMVIYKGKNKFHFIGVSLFLIGFFNVPLSVIFRVSLLILLEEIGLKGFSGLI